MLTNEREALRALADEHPRAGDGATIHVGSDEYPATVITVSPSGHRMTLQRDEYRRGIWGIHTHTTDGNGQSEAQSYEFERDPNGKIETACRCKDGRYRLTGRRGLVTIGERSAYRDPSF